MFSAPPPRLQHTWRVWIDLIFFQVSSENSWGKVGIFPSPRKLRKTKPMEAHPSPQPHFPLLAQNMLWLSPEMWRHSKLVWKASIAAEEPGKLHWLISLFQKSLGTLFLRLPVARDASEHAQKLPFTSGKRISQYLLVQFIKQRGRLFVSHECCTRANDISATVRPSKLVLLTAPPSWAEVSFGKKCCQDWIAAAERFLWHWDKPLETRPLKPLVMGQTIRNKAWTMGFLNWLKNYYYIMELLYNRIEFLVHCFWRKKGSLNFR